jgi:DNA-binding response OmpR family regulator
MASTVLIVEDDPTTTDFVQRYLRRDAHRVLTAADGVERSTFAFDLPIQDQ